MPLSPPPNIFPTPNIRMDTGGLVTPVYTERRMRCYQIFDTELKSLSLTTAIVTICFSLGSAALTTAINIPRDIALSGQFTEGAKALDSVMKPACYFLAFVFFVAALAALWWRHDLITTIKHQSGDGSGEGGWWRIWRSPIKRTPSA